MQTSPNRVSPAVWQVLLSLSILALLVVFIASEWSGMVRLGALLRGAVENSPTFVGEIIDYYRGVTTDALIRSLLMGALFGALLTPLIALMRRGWWQVPPSRWGSLSALTALGLALFGLDIWLVLGLAILAYGGVSLATEKTWRVFWGQQALPALSRGGWRTALQGLFAGALVGGLGGQLLIYPTQHCTYAAEAPRIQADLGIFVTWAGALIFLLPLWTLAFRQSGTSNPEASAAGYFRGRLMPYLLLLPNLLILALFLYYPAVQLITLSLRSRIFGVPRERFVCLDNYVKLADDPVYQNSFFTTLFVTFALVVITLALALAIAVLASQKVKGAGVYRAFLIWPFALSPIISGIIFLSLFREGNSGLVNYFLGTIFGFQGRWLTDPTLARWLVIMTAVWNSLGFSILFYIAGLQNIPEDLVQAAALDGANVFQRFFRIVFPLLSPFTFFLLVTNVTYALYGIYGVVDALTNGGPPLGAGGQAGGATDVLIYKLYQDSFGTGASVGSAGAQALILFLLVALITLVQFRYVENRVTYSG